MGGTEVYLKNLLVEIRRLRPNIELFLTVFSKNNSIFTPHVNSIEDSIFTRFLDSWGALRLQYRYRILGSMSFLWGLFWFCIASARMTSKHNIQVIYANGGHLSALTAYFLHKIFHIPYVVHFHGVFDFSELFTSTALSPRKLLLAGVTQNMLEEASHVIANSRDVFEDIGRVKNRMKNCSIVHCFVNRKTFFPRDQRACRKALDLPDNAFIILSANRLDRSKKIPFLISSAAGMAQKVICILIGDGQMRSEIETLVKKDKRFVYYRQVTNEELPLFINAADIVWGVCSVYYISLTLIEALACGVPIIASREPSPIDMKWGSNVKPETLPRDIGFLVDESIIKVSRLFDRLSQRRNQLEAMRSACIHFYESVYGTKNINRILGIINSVTQKIR